jgi:Protein of unknown function (DUF1759)
VCIAKLNANASFVSEENEENKNFKDCEPRRLDMVNTLQRFSYLTEELGKLVTTEQWLFEMEYMQKVEENFMRIMSKLSVTSSAQPTKKEAPKVKSITLLQLEIAQFDGNADSWIQFRDQYDSTIHENADLQSVQKFRYLLSFLKDEAKELVADITISNDEYNTALNLLLQHFNNPLKIIKSYI